ncbi:MAG: polysaccharide biosynthesis C-terminal domain-containing protein [Bacteroidia bacterium]|nr:polysaccharide biosynthesis C-terminal domain-containing protein [Bacteroidia bacterium]
MLKNAFLTIGTRGLIVVVNFLTAILSARYLGAEGKGIISLFTLNMNIIVVFSFFVGGPGLIYLFPRSEVNKLFYASLVWGTACSVVLTPVLSIFSKDAMDYFPELLAIVWLQAVYRIIANYFIAAERIADFNKLSLLYPIITIGLALLLFERFHNTTPGAFMMAMIVGSLVSVIAGLWMMRNDKVLIPVINFKETLIQALRYGFVVQLGNMIQLVNYRISFYFLDYYSGKAELGIFSMAVSFAEGVWIIATSFALNLYSLISNNENEQYNLSTSLSGMRISLVLTVIPCLILIVIPAFIYTFILGSDFNSINSVFPYLLPGVWLLTINISLVNFFTGTGRKWVSTVCAAFGMISLLVTSYILIPKAGMRGAAAATSISYFTSVIAVLIYFNRYYKLSLTDFILKRSDLKQTSILK